MIKKVAAILLILTMVFTLTGCDVSNIFSYWDGITKDQTIKYVQDTLQEKYSEDFSVKNLAIRSGSSWDANPILLADCSPISDENIVFEIEVYVRGKDEDRIRRMYDNYIQNVVRKQLKQTIDEVLAENYENFVSQVFVTPLNYWYDSGLRSANNATIKNFSESFTDNDDNYTLVYIAIKESEKDFDKIKNALQELSNNFYSLNVSIDCYYTDEHTIEQCKKTIGKSYKEIGITDILRTGNFEMDDFVFFNDDRGLVYIPKDD